MIMGPSLKLFKQGIGVNYSLSSLLVFHLAQKFFTEVKTQ